MKVGLAQMCSGLDPATNLEAAAALIREAAGAGAQLVITPEMTNIVDLKPRRLFDSLPDDGGEREMRFFEDLAAELGIHLLTGSLAIAHDREPATRRAANRSCLFGPGGLVATYDKLHMFDVDLPNGESWKESAIYAPGDRAVMADLPVGRLGLTICYDLRFPRLYRDLSRIGAQMLAVPAAFTRQTGEAHWESLLRARAIENGAFVLAAAQGGTHEDGRETWGHSMVINPWGRVLAVKEDRDPGVIVAEIDLDEVKEARQRIPSLGLEQDWSIAQI